MSERKTAFIALIGRPNVGKSTLMNAILGEKVSIVSNKPQTTRNRILGIHTVGDDQFVFLDTPGIFKPRNALGEYMVHTADATAADADAVILLVDPTRESIGDVEENVMNDLKKNQAPAILAVNKIDLAKPEEIANCLKMYSEAYSFKAFVPISAKSGKNVRELLDECRQFLIPSEWFYAEDMMTDQPVRQMASEIIREKLLRTLDKEVPHGIAVVIEEFREDEGVYRIRAEIYCEKESHKGIIVGKGGEELKRVGSYARADLEKLLGKPVYLNLWVKVKDNWRESARSVSNFGYTDKD